MAALVRFQPLIAILLVALAVRVGAAVLLPDQNHVLHDAESFRDAARSLLAAGKIQSAFLMPVYPLAVASTGGGIGQICADIAFSILSVWLVYAIGIEIFKSAKIALLAALGAALYPPLIFFSVVGLSETLFTALLLGAFLFWYRNRFLAASIFAVLAILTRPVFELAAVTLLLCFALIVHRLSWTYTLRHLAIFGAVYAALMSPWWIHNYMQYGQFVRLTAGFGTALFAGNNPMNQTGGGNVGEDYDLAPYSKITDPIERDRTLCAAATNFIASNPVRFVELAGLKFVRMWGPWPRHEAYASPAPILIAIASVVPVMVLSVVYLYLYGRQDFRLISPVLLLIGYLTLVHMVLVGTIRYRLPLEPFLLIFASVAVVRTLLPITARASAPRKLRDR